MYGVPLLGVPQVVTRGCGGRPRYVGENITLPIPSGRQVGDCLGRVTSMYNVGGALDARVTHRAFTYVTVTGGISVRSVTGVLKRSSLEAAGVCTGLVSGAISRRVGVLGQGFDTL